MLRRTKIVTTLGPATDNAESLEALFKAGANVVRMNFSHGEPEDHIKRAKIVRQVAKKLGLNIAIMGDLQGPKIRIARYKNKNVTVEKGQAYAFDADLDRDAGDETQVGIDYRELPNECEVGDILLLDDGRLEFEITAINGMRIDTTVIVGGDLSNNKGINKKGGGLSAPALTEKDKRDIITAAEMEVDYLAVSFPRSADDINQARSLAKEAGLNAGIVAKIERAETVNDPEILDSIIKASSAVMVARGDLGVEIGDAELIGVQKRIIQRARALDRAVITATQMMESMITNAIPTRAEVFDVANAVLDGTDAVMLSAETAMGAHPIKVVEAVSRVCIGAEKEPSNKISGHRAEIQWDNIDDAVALATMYAANHLNGIKAIVCLTESGHTPLIMSRIRSGIPIFALTRLTSTYRRMALYRGVEAIEFDPTVLARHDVNRLAVAEVCKRMDLKSDDLVLLTKGDHMGKLGGTNAIKFLRVGKIV
ncbi:MAG: pyruvate kinase [Gammaproteobacteria bacterium]|nr:MAG: pyruvate kinase [Gammaproteobacteria bacterium]